MEVTEGRMPRSLHRAFGPPITSPPPRRKLGQERKARQRGEGGRGERPTRMAADLGEPFDGLRAVSNVEPLGRAVNCQHQYETVQISRSLQTV